MLLALALTKGGGSPEGRGSTPARNAAVNEGRGSLPRDQSRGTPAPENPNPLPPKTPSEIRFAEAQAKLDNIKDMERTGRMDAAEIRRRYREFAREYANTAQGRTDGKRLWTTPLNLAPGDHPHWLPIAPAFLRQKVHDEPI